MRSVGLKVAIPLLVLVALPFIPPFSRQDLLSWLVAAALLSALAVAFDFSAGYINVVNFGFAAFSGAGGYASALAVQHLGISPFLGLVPGALFAGVLGFATGVVTLRLRGIYAAIVAWFLGLALLGLATNLTGITRGALGLEAPPFFNSGSNRPDYFVALALLAGTFVILSLIIRSSAGLAFRAIGQNIEAARASGLDPTRYRVLNFTLSCMFAGLLGGFYAHHYGILTPEVMSTTHTVEVIVVVYLGGRGSLWGPALVAFPYVFLRNWLDTTFSGYPGLSLVLFGVLLIIMLIYYPGGLAGIVKQTSEWFRRRASKGRSEATVGTAGSAGSAGSGEGSYAAH